MSISMRLEHIGNAVRQLLEQQFKERTGLTARALKDARHECQTEAGHIVECEVVLYELEQILHKREAAAQNQSATEEDFEKLHRMQNGRKVRVEDPWIMIETRRLFQKTTSCLEPYDIGQKEIQINVGADEVVAVHNIRFEDGPYLGKYVHVNSKSGSLCFGNTTHGIGSDVAALLQDLATPDLVHLLLSFLQRDETGPQLRFPEKTGQWTTPSLSSGEKPAVFVPYDAAMETGYASDEERNEVKARYVALLREAGTKRGTKEIRKRIEEAQASLNRHTASWLSHRDHVLVLEEQKQGYEAYRLRMLATVREYAQFFDRYAKNVRYEKNPASNQEALIISFRVKNNDLELRVTPSGHIRLLGVPQSHRLAKVIGHDGTLVGLHEPAHQRLVRLACDGNLPALFEELHAILEKGGV